MVRSGRRRPVGVSVGTLVIAALIVVSLLGPSVAAAQQTAPEVDNTVTRIQVNPDGDARWIVQIRTRLETQQQVADYRAFQEAIRQNTSRYLDPFSDRIQAVVTQAANATGRPMAASNFSASTSIQEVPRRWGIVTFEFTWSGFAEQREGELVVGDVFQGGFFLAANDSLEIAVPDGYEVTSVEPAPDDRDAGELIWRGREDFSDGHPVVVFEASQSPTPTGRTSPTGQSAVPYLGGALMLAIVVIGSYALWRRRSSGSRSTGSDTSPETARTEDDGTGSAANEDPVKTDPERVRALIEEHGGRLKQADIAEELDWSASKVSRVISGMVDEGSVRKLQLGRENLVKLSEDD